LKTRRELNGGPHASCLWFQGAESPWGQGGKKPKETSTKGPLIVKEHPNVALLAKKKGQQAQGGGRGEPGGGNPQSLFKEIRGKKAGRCPPLHHRKNTTKQKMLPTRKGRKKNRTICPAED